jgi:hypothetical protein
MFLVQSIKFITPSKKWLFDMKRGHSLPWFGPNVLSAVGQKKQSRDPTIPFGLNAIPLSRGQPEHIRSN